LLCALIAAAHCRSTDSRPLVVTSFLPIYCWTINIAGEHARVENLLPSRAEPHEYAFTSSDARKLSHADLVIVNGVSLEGWLPKFASLAPNSAKNLVTLSESLRPQLISDNPHLWLDPQLAVAAVTNITAALQRIDATHAPRFASNATAYITRLQKLDADIRQELSGVTNRAIVTYHDAFPYFARRYGFEVVGVVEKVPEVNPTPKYLARLRRTMKERNVQAIFIPPNSASRLARQIAEDFHVQLVELDTIETGALTPDAYERAMRNNAAVLRKTLR
jgi:zinc transport system substrate-binding protein